MACSIKTSKQLSKIMFEFKWVLKVDSLKEMVENQKVVSPSYFVTDVTNTTTEWKLVLFPNGVKVDHFSTKDVALYLFYPTHDYCTAAIFSIAFLNKYNKKVHVQTKEYTFQSNVAAGFDYGLLKCLTDERNNLINKNNELTIMCSINVTEIIDIKTFKDPLLLEIKEEELARLEKSNVHKKLFNEKEYSDVTVITGDKKFFLHKCILATCSSVFAALFAQNSNEKEKYTIEMKDFDYRVLKTFFLFIYTGEFHGYYNEFSCIADELLRLAERYNVLELKSFCEENMCLDINQFNVVKYLKLSIIFKAEKLKMHTVHWISSRINSIKQDPEFKEFTLMYPEFFKNITVANK